MKLDFLPKHLKDAINQIDINQLYEIRLRTNYPIKINYNNKIYYLLNNGISLFNNNSIICNNDDIEYIINQITEHSIFAFNDRIKEGYITTSKGVRVGLAGECVFNNGKIQTIKNILSLNIRIPHLINECSKNFFNKIVDHNNKIFSTLIISCPFLGKTTILKDIAIKVNKLNFCSILIIDERGEFSEVSGENIDSIKYSDKLYAFNYGIRSMSPTLIITDELINENDWQCVKNAISSGVKIIASCHCDNLEHLKFKNFFIKDLFDRYVVLKNSENFGQVDKIYNKDFDII